MLNSEEKEIEVKEEEIIETLTDFEPFRAYRKANLLWLKLPSPFKQKLSTYFEKADKTLKNVKTTEFYLRSMEQHKLLKYSIMPYLIERIASVLHEMEKEGVEA